MNNRSKDNYYWSSIQLQRQITIVHLHGMPTTVLLPALGWNQHHHDVLRSMSSGQKDTNLNIRHKVEQISPTTSNLINLKFKQPQNIIGFFLYHVLPIHQVTRNPAYNQYIDSTYITTYTDKHVRT